MLTLTNNSSNHQTRMEYSPVLYCLLALLPLLYLLKSLLASGNSHHGNSLRLPPSPWQLPIIGSLHHLHGALPHRALRGLARRHGPVMLLKFGEVPVVVASSREAAKEILKTHDAVTATRPQTTTFKILSKRGQGIALAPYGDHWRQLRKICNMELLSPKHVQSFRAIREDEAARLVQSITSASALPMNLSKMLAGYVADAALRVIMGDRLKDRDAFIQQLAEGVRLAAGFSLADFFPSSRLARLLSRSARKVEIHRAAMLELMDSVIGEHMQRRSDGHPREEEDMVDVLLRLQRDGGLQIPLTMDTVKAVVIDLFAGSNDTSATTLQWAMAELMRNPSVMSKLQDEVTGAFAATMKVTEEGLHELSYLHMVTKETLRLHLPSPLLLPRESVEQCQILGYDVPKGTMVMVNAGALSIDPDYWDEPEVFRPERFQDSEKDFKGNEFEFIPFGAGRRICPGMFFGLANIELALAYLVFYFDWSLPEGVSCSELDMTESAGITVRKKTDLWVRATLNSMLHR